MKKIMSIIASSLLCFGAFAQELQNNVQMSVYFDAENMSVPQNSAALLASRIKAILGRNLLGATDDFAQFFVTCDANKVECDILPGAPTKYRQVVDLNFYVMDAFAKKMFASETISIRAVANSEQKAYTECFRQIRVDDKTLAAFFKNTSDRILSYYNAQYPAIIEIARSLASVKEYEQALFRLSAVPEACVGYPEVAAAATEVFRKYLDHQAAENLSRATAIWNAGQNSEAAFAAAEFIAQISPDSSYYGKAQELLSEIKTTVKDNIAFERRIQEKVLDNRHKESMASIDAWKAVGVAYGNNQKSNTYHDAWLVR